MSGLILPVAAPVAPVTPVLPPGAPAERDTSGASFAALLTALLPLAAGQPRPVLLRPNPAPSAGADPEEVIASEADSEASATAEAASSSTSEQTVSGSEPDGRGLALTHRSHAPNPPSHPAVATPEAESNGTAVSRRAAASETGETRALASTLETSVVGSERGGSRMVDTGRIERDLELLAPEFRVRLERVVTRMEAEHGHRVDVVETLRNQVRQNHLYEQGRSRPGPVVTWTRSSNHTQGVAADVIIDGSHDNPAAYARLHRVAAEEGLRTLGARDPGHLELPRGSQAAGAPQPMADADPAAAHAGRRFGERRPVQTRATQPAQPAQPAQPVLAAVARVATVAAPRVASVAQPGSPVKRSDDTARPASDPGVPSLPAPELPRTHSPAYAQASSPDLAGAEAVASGPIRSGSAERLAHLLDLQSGAPLRPLSQVLLRVDGPSGEDRIRLDLRGVALGATIDVNDPAVAKSLNARVGDLQRALEQRGLEADSLRIRATPRLDTVEISRLALGATDGEIHRTNAVRTGSDSSGSRDRSQHSPSDEPHQNPADSRHRSRREHKGGKNT